MTTAYLLVAIQLEERDLIKGLGQDYVDYRKRIPMILPIRVRRAVTRILKDEDIV